MKTASAGAPFDFVAEGHKPVFIIGGRPMMKISRRGAADEWQELPMSAFSPAQQSEIKRLTAWRLIPRAEREEIIKCRLAALINF